MDASEVAAAAQEAERLAYLADTGPHSAPSATVPPAVYAQLAHAWAVIALARAVVIHADRLPPT